MSQDEVRFRVWPGQALEPIPVRIPDCSLEIGGRVILARSGDRRPALLPSDFFIRELLAFDADDSEALLGFCNAYGLPVEPDYSGEGALDEVLSPLAEDFRARLATIAESLSLPEGSLDQAVFATFMKEEAEPLGPSDSMYSLHAVRRSLSRLRNMARMWLAIRDVIPWRQLREEWEPLPEPMGDTPEAAAGFLSMYLTNGLSPFHAWVSDDPNSPMNQPSVGLYPAVCLQLYNAIAEWNPIRECARCSSLFERQRGDSGEASWKPRMEGVEYCSRSCAKAAATDEYRKRLVLTRTLMDEGQSREHIAAAINETLREGKKPVTLESVDRLMAAVNKRRTQKGDAS